MKSQLRAYKAKHQQRPFVRTPYVPKNRAGYSSVARTRGAAVTGEMKYFDCEKTATSVSAVTTTWVAGTMVDPTTTINLGDAGVATPLCLFAPKATASLNGRVGRSVNVLKIKINGTINVPAQSAAATADSASKVRIMLVQDLQTNAAQMTGAALLRDAGAADTTINSFQNPDNFGRFRVLKDKIITFSNVSMTGAATVIEQSGMVHSFKMTVTFRTPVVVHFNAANGGTVADIVDNSFHFVAGCSSVSLVPTLSYYSRVTYKE